MQRDFEGGIYWDELAEICSGISRTAGFRGAARFRGNTVYVCLCSSIDSASPGYTVCVHVHVRPTLNTEVRFIQSRDLCQPLANC